MSVYPCHASLDIKNLLPLLLASPALCLHVSILPPLIPPCIHISRNMQDAGLFAESPAVSPSISPSAMAPPSPTVSTIKQRAFAVAAQRAICGMRPWGEEEGEGVKP